MHRCKLLGVLLAGVGVGVAAQWLVESGAAYADPAAPALQKWVKGKGWGWVWGKSDEVGSLNEMTDTSRLAALRLAKTGKVYDLGILYSRQSYKWPGHSPGEVMSFRTPEGVKRQGDVGPFADPVGNADQMAWHSCALFINDNVATQIDGLGHVTTGADNHWYNGFTESQWGGNFGVRRCSADTIPPIVARGVLIDVAGSKGVASLPAHYVISIDDVKAALARQGTELVPGDVVLLRTGTLAHWGRDGADHETIGAHDSAGPDLGTVKYLVEQHGAMLIGSDTSGLECAPAPKGARSPIPVHQFLLIEQGIHIGEFHYLEDLARDGAYEFCYVALVNKIAGSTAGFCLRPIALR